MSRRVLFLVNHDIVIYNFRLELVEALLDHGYEVHISSPEGSRIADLVRLGCKYHSTKISRHGMNPFRELGLLQFYLRLIRSVKPEVVLTYTIKPNIYGGIACSILGTPCIANITGLGTAVEGNGILQSLARTLYKYGLKGDRMVFFQNKANMQFMLDEGMVSGRYELLPGSGVNLDRFQPMPYGSAEKVRFSYIARVMEEKGINQFLEAAAIISSSYSNAEFHVYGEREPEYRGKLDELDARGIVHYHGRVNDMLSVYRDTDCTVLPTYYPEGMSNVLLESCACARPIITTNRPGCGEIVDDGVNGFVVLERDSLNLVDKIMAFLSLTVDERKQMGLNGRAKVQREFDRNIVVQKYLQEIQSLEDSE